MLYRLLSAPGLEDGDRTFKPFFILQKSGNINADVPVHMLVYDSVTKDLYTGSDTSVITDLKIVEEKHLLFAGTLSLVGRVACLKSWLAIVI